VLAIWFSSNNSPFEGVHMVRPSEYELSSTWSTDHDDTSCITVTCHTSYVTAT